MKKCFSALTLGVLLTSVSAFANHCVFDVQTLLDADAVNLKRLIKDANKKKDYAIKWEKTVREEISGYVSSSVGFSIGFITFTQYNEPEEVIWRERQERLAPQEIRNLIADYYISEESDCRSRETRRSEIVSCDHYYKVYDKNGKQILNSAIVATKGGVAGRSREWSQRTGQYQQGDFWQDSPVKKTKVVIDLINQLKGTCDN